MAWRVESVMDQRLGFIAGLSAGRRADEQSMFAARDQPQDGLQMVEPVSRFRRIIDSQTVKSAAEKGEFSVDPHGYDAGKKIKGENRHSAVDTQGLLRSRWFIPPTSMTVTAASFS